MSEGKRIMADVTVIGRGTKIRGRVSGAVDLEIQGHVEGEVAIDGDLVIDRDGTVGASVSARRLTVRGAVKGDLNASDAVLLEEGARVLGDIRAPRIAIAQGALVKGYVQTGDDASAKPRARTEVRALPRPAAAPAARVVPAAKPIAKSAPARNPAPAAAPPPPPSAPRIAPPPAAAAKQGPPAPVVPALKKGAKGALKKKA
jgi:cytoskeletal protein CcmA (bactofilin family)